MEDKKFNEYDSLELIAKTIERARKTEIGRLNFITLYGILGLATCNLSTDLVINNRHDNN